MDKPRKTTRARKDNQPKRSKKTVKKAPGGGKPDNSKHREDFEQLLDDAVFGVKSPAKGGSRGEEK